jgi:GTPase
MGNLVCIVGRPNVGKSTFFNRMIGRKDAIIDNKSGVTRDNKYGSVDWLDKTFTLMDTGGLVKGSDDIFEEAIRKQVLSGLEKADFLLFMVDLRAGLTGLDQDVADLVRRLDKPTFLLVNKADTPDKVSLAGEFFKLGFADVFPISSESGSGTGELLDALIKKLPEKGTKEKGGIARIAFVGRPNVGKSSLTNMLLGYERSIVTPKAGTTRDPVNALMKGFGQEFMLLDTAGLRRKSKVTDDLEFYSVLRAVRAIEDSDICVLLIDAQQGLESQDMSILHLAIQRKKGVLILVNKWDLVEKEQNSIKEYEEFMLNKLGTLRYIPIQFISVLEKIRVYKALEMINQIYEERKKKIPTSKLNQTMLNKIEERPPAMERGKSVKIKYITQLPTHTPSFAFFCNFPKAIKPSYKKYLENQLRKEFGFTGIPISLVFKKK